MGLSLGCKERAVYKEETFQSHHGQPTLVWPSLQVEHSHQKHTTP